MHTCRECGKICYCNGDSDDFDVDDERAEINCTCCLEFTDDEFRFYDYDADDATI